MDRLQYEKAIEDLEQYLDEMYQSGEIEDGELEQMMRTGTRRIRQKYLLGGEK